MDKGRLREAPEPNIVVHGSEHGSTGKAAFKADYLKMI